MSDLPQALSVSRIDPNPYQPRTEFPHRQQQELMESIRQHGLIQPIVVRPAGSRYQLLAGERRLRAVVELGLPMVSAIVRELSEEAMQTQSIIENVQREDLGAMDLALGLQALHDRQGLSHDELAKRLGKDRSTIANTLRLLELPAEIRQDISANRLSAGHGRALLPLKESQKIYAVRDEILRKNLSVRESERLVKSSLSDRTRKRKKGEEGGGKSIHLRELESRLSERLSTRVEIWGEEKGSLQIAFASVQEFNRIFNEIMENGES